MVAPLACQKLEFRDNLRLDASVGLLELVVASRHVWSDRRTRLHVDYLAGQQRFAPPELIAADWVPVLVVPELADLEAGNRSGRGGVLHLEGRDDFVVQPLGDRL